MGFYSRTIFPCLCDLLLDRPFIKQYRSELLSSATGSILEIGFGTGLNLPLYPRHVHQLTVVDPNLGMLRRARRRIDQTGIKVEARQVSSEQLPFDENSFDCVVSTFTLCSIAQVGRALGEVYRTLAPGGRFLFLEHGLSPEPSVGSWQRRLNWLEMRLADGCRLDRNIRALVTSQSFSSVALNEFYMEKVPRTHGYIYRGIATK
jgi:ubiquinone/menaquinone biosynthesis C-methylase UbiE